MEAAQILSLVSTILSCTVAITSIIAFVSNRRKHYDAYVEQKEQAKNDLEKIKSQNENLLQDNKKIFDKLEAQDKRLTKIEQTVSDAQLSQMPKQIAELQTEIRIISKKTNK